MMGEQMSEPAALVRLSCGRRFSWRDYGDPAGRPVIALHGTPGSHLKFADAAEGAARDLGLRLIALDRWAYGLSDAPAVPSLAAFAADIAELADLLRLGRFAVLGISGGGPFAAAVAASLGDRVWASALVAPVGPVTAITPPPRLDPYHYVAFRILPKLPGVLPAVFGAFRLICRRSPKLATRIAARRARTADRALARDDRFAHGLGRAFTEGLDVNARGPVIDLRLFGKSWSVDLARTTAPTRIWRGSDDHNVPAAAIDGLAREIARGAVRPTIENLDGQGHFWIARNFPTVLGWMAEQAG